MAARGRARRWAAVIAVLAGLCAAGCSGSSSSSSPTALPSGAVTVPPAGSASGSIGKLTGHFCTDVQKIGASARLPADAQGSLSAAKQHGVPYLGQLRAYFNGLAGEAPAKLKSSLRTIAATVQQLAAAVSAGNYSSPAKIEQQLQSLSTNGPSGTAFRNLLAYMVTKCP